MSRPSSPLTRTAVYADQVGESPVYLSLDTQRLTIVTIATAEREGHSLITSGAYLANKRGAEADEDNRPIAFGAYGTYKRGAEVDSCPFTSCNKISLL
jgi:hypothetical protein